MVGGKGMKYIVLLRSNIRKQKGSVIGIFLLMLIITVTLSSVLAIWDNSEIYVESEMNRVNYGDVIYWVSNKSDIDALQKDIQSMKDIDLAEVEQIVYVNCIVNGIESTSNVLLSVYDAQNYDYHIFRESTTEYESNPEILKQGEIYAPVSFKSIYDASIGDSFFIKNTTLGKEKNYKIKGFYEDPTAGSTMMGMKNSLISKEDMDILLEETEDIETDVEAAYCIHVFQSEDSSLTEKELQHKISTETNIGQYTISAYIKNSIVGFMLMLQNIFIGFLISFVAILLVVSVIIIGHSIRSSIEQQYEDLGILKATGYTENDLRLIHILQYMMTLCMGFVAGICFSHLLVRNINRMLLPVTGIMTPDTIPIGLTFFCFGFIFGFIFLFILIKTIKIGRITPITAIRGEREDNFFRSHIHVAIHGKALSFWLAIRQLTTGGKHYIGACIITALLVFFLTLCGRIQSWMGPDGNGIMNAMGMASVDGRTYDMGITFQEDEIKKEVETLILTKTPIKTVYCTLSRTAQLGHTEYLMNVISNPEYFHMVKGRYCRNNNEIVITDTVAKEMNLAIGDTVTVSLGNKEADYIITGINQCAIDMGENFGVSTEGYKRIDDGTGQYFYNYILENSKEKSIICEQLKDEYGDQIYIDENTWSGLDGIVGASDALGYLMYGVSMIFILIVVFMTGSKILYQEQHNLGVFKSLGFQSKYLRISFALRFVIVSVIGSILGVFLSIIFTDPIVGKMFTFFGVSNFSSKLSTENTLESTAIVTLIFFLFAYLAGGKIKKTTPGILIVE